MYEPLSHSLSSLRSSIKRSLGDKRWLISLLPIIFFTVWFGLGANRLWDRDEPRNARCAAEMIERNDWVVPMFNDQLRTHKPILLYWLQMTSYSLLGESDFAARCGSAFMATMAVLSIYLLCSVCVGRKYAFWSAAALSTSLMFIVASRAATPDASLISTSCIAIVFLVLHWKRSQSKRGWYFVAGYASLGLAVLAKGPVGIILPLVVVTTWCYVQLTDAVFRQWLLKLPVNDGTLVERIRKTFHTIYLSFVQTNWLSELKSLGRDIITIGIRLQLSWGLLLALAVCTPWYIWVGIRTDGEWLYGFFYEHNFSRAVSAMEGHQGGVWFYPLAALVGLFPWSLLCIPILHWVCLQLWPENANKHLISDRSRLSNRTSMNAHHPLSSVRHNEAQEVELRSLVQLGVVWMYVYIALFSFAKTKLPSYITPCYPGAGLLIGGFLYAWTNGSFKIQSRLLQLGASVFGITGIAIIGALVVASQSLGLSKLIWSSIWPIGFIVAAGVMIYASRTSHQKSIAWYALTAAVVFISGMFSVAAPTIDTARRDLDTILAYSTRADIDGNQVPTRWMSIRAIEPSWVHYLRRPIVELGVVDQNQIQEVAMELDKGVQTTPSHPAANRLVSFQKAASTEDLSPDRSADLSENFEKIRQVASHLESGGYLIVDGNGFDSLQKLLEKGWSLHIESVANFSTFLKRNDILIVRTKPTKVSLTR